MHEVADHDGMLSARTDIDAAMARRVAWRWRQPDIVVELKVVIDQQRLSGSNDRLAIIRPDIAAAAGTVAALARFFFPGGIFAFVEDVLRIRKCRHPAAITQHRVPAGMVDVKVGAEHVIDVFELQPFGMEAVEPRLLRKIHRRWIAFVLAGAGIDQDGVLRRAHDKGLVGDDHFPGCRIEYFLVQRSEMPLANLGIVGREHVLRLPPRSIALDDAGNSDVANRKFFHLGLSEFRLSRCRLLHWRSGRKAGLYRRDLAVARRSGSPAIRQRRPY